MRVYTAKSKLRLLFNSYMALGDRRLVLAAEDFLQPSHLLLVALNFALALCELLHQILHPAKEQRWATFNLTKSKELGFALVDGCVLHLGFRKLHVQN